MVWIGRVPRVKPPASDTSADLRGRVVEAASRCFRSYGIRKTSMEDVAEAAGLSRPAVYRLFPGRQALIDAVMSVRVEELIDEVVPRALARPTFAESILEACLRAITFIRETPDLYRLFNETNLGRASTELLRTRSGGLELGYRVWKPLLDRGRERNEVRPGVIDNDFIEWVSTLILVYSERDDLPLDRLSTLFWNNLVPIVALPCDLAERRPSAVRSAGEETPHP